jgi:hypothetical protein
MKVIKTLFITLFLFLHYGTLVLGNTSSKSHALLTDKSKKIETILSKSKLPAKSAMIMGNGVSVPADYPHVYITINDNPSEGNIFLTTSWGTWPHYSLILDNNGDPVWYMRTGGEERRDFKVQPNGWATMLVRGGYGGSGVGFIALDEQYNHVHTFRTVGEYSTDEHELQVLPHGGYLIIGRRGLDVDMSNYIPEDDRIVNIRETCIQEFNADDQLIRTYPAFDYFNPADLWPEELSKSWDIRFPHMNAIDIDNDGHIILSSCYLDEITKINRNTKEIIWRLGGAHSDFVFKNDALNGFSGQHSVRVVGPNRYLLFDNGNHHNPQVSRAVEYELNLNANPKTATLVWEFREPGRYSWYMGNVQRLPNGNTLINWAVGYLPKLTEVRPDCTKVFEMNYVDQHDCYRVHRCQWNGAAEKPYLIAESHREAVELIFNQFGDPDVDYYKIYGSTSPNPITKIDTSRTTMKTITNLENHQQYYFRVTAVSGASESDFSNEEDVNTNFIEPGSNMVLNGDFSDSKDYWYFYDENPASASWSIEDGVGHIQISQGGNNPEQIFLVQDGIEVLRGEAYLFEFDAWADAPRAIEAVIMQYPGLLTNYSQTGQTVLTTTPIHYAYPFTMEDPSDFNALVIFFLGNSNSDVYIDNISLKRTTGTDVREKPVLIPQQVKLTGNYPNPFNAETTINFSIPVKSRVRIELVNILGQFEQTLCDRIYEAGNHHIRLNGNRLSSGIYFCKMEAKKTDDSQIHRDVHKMILLK